MKCNRFFIFGTDGPLLVHFARGAIRFLPVQDDVPGVHWIAIEVTKGETKDRGIGLEARRASLWTTNTLQNLTVLLVSI
jgi:hypothetical protein